MSRADAVANDAPLANVAAAGTSGDGASLPRPRRRQVGQRRARPGQGCSSSTGSSPARAPRVGPRLRRRRHRRRARLRLRGGPPCRRTRGTGSTPARRHSCVASGDPALASGRPWPGSGAPCTSRSSAPQPAADARHPAVVGLLESAHAARRGRRRRRPRFSHAARRPPVTAATALTVPTALADLANAVTRTHRLVSRRRRDRRGRRPRRAGRRAVRAVVRGSFDARSGRRDDPPLHASDLLPALRAAHPRYAHFVNSCGRRRDAARRGHGDAERRRARCCDPGEYVAHRSAGRAARAGRAGGGDRPYDQLDAERRLCGRSASEPDPRWARLPRRARRHRPPVAHQSRPRSTPSRCAGR